MATGSGEISISMADVTKDMTLTISLTGMRSWRIRWWIGTRIMLLGAWIIGMDADIIDNGN